MSKRLIFLFLSIWLVFLLPINAYAHPGNTDSSGGHYNHSTGKYHYHHGYPEHQHTNGKCPYSDSDDSDGGILKGLDFGTAAFITVGLTIVLTILLYKMEIHSIFTDDEFFSFLINVLIANILAVLILIFVRNVIV